MRNWGRGYGYEPPEPEVSEGWAWVSAIADFVAMVAGVAAILAIMIILYGPLTDVVEWIKAALLLR